MRCVERPASDFVCSGGGTRSLMFRRLYDWVVRASGHRRAPSLLALLAFSESSFFPIPPDVMLAPMTLARPERAWWFAAITTVASVVGAGTGISSAQQAHKAACILIVDMRDEEVVCARTCKDLEGGGVSFVFSVYAHNPFHFITPLCPSP